MNNYSLGSKFHSNSKHTPKTMPISKLVLLVVAALAAPLAMTQAAGAPIIPAWCSCSDNKSLTQTVCGRAGGNWDGGSCGLDSVPKFNSFGNNCYSLGGRGRCWN